MEPPLLFPLRAFFPIFFVGGGCAPFRFSGNKKGAFHPESRVPQAQKRGASLVFISNPDPLFLVRTGERKDRIHTCIYSFFFFFFFFKKPSLERAPRGERTAGL